MYLVLFLSLLISLPTFALTEAKKRTPASAPEFQVSKITNSKCSRAERWFDSVNSIVCYSASPGGSTSFRMSCISFSRSQSTTRPAMALQVAGSAYSRAEAWVDQDLGVVCALASPGGSDSFDLSCKETL